MNVVDTLMKGVRADLEVLRVLKEKGDDFSRFRNVTFLFRCPDKEKAEFVSGFLADHNFAETHFLQSDGQFSVEAEINMPIQQQIITTVAGFMTVIAAIYNSEFDGWTCKVTSK